MLQSTLEFGGKKEKNPTTIISIKPLKEAFCSCQCYTALGIPKIVDKELIPNVTQVTEVSWRKHNEGLLWMALHWAEEPLGYGSTI